MSRKGSTAVNVARIAELCGVSAMTVSRALRANGEVSEATREKVLATAESLGYRLQVKRGRPRRQKTERRPVVEVLLGTGIAPESVYASRLLVSIEQELGRRRHDCIIRTCGGDYAQFVSMCEAMRQGPVAGTLVVGHFALEQLQTILELAPTAILVDNEGDPRLATACETISYDNAEAARLAVRHLAGLGRRRILLLSGPAEHYFSRRLELGYRELHAALSLPLDEALIRASDYTCRGARDTVARLLAEGLRFDAVFTNDEMALGVLRALTDAGRKVPEEIALVGCDGLAMGEVMSPSLTTILLDATRLGELAVARIFTRQAGQEAEYRLQLLPRLVLRESSSSGGSP